MVTGTGGESRDLTHFERLVRDPKSHHIFFAMRVLEAHFDQSPRLGTARRPGQEKVRFGQEPDLAFPKSTVTGFEHQTAEAPAKLTNLFFGLFGPHGPLPLHLTEYARSRKINHHDPTFVAFADMLTHRAMSLLYRAWMRGEPAVAFDRGEKTETEMKIGALAGYFGTHLRDRDAMPDLAKLQYSGVLSAAPKNAEGLIALLGGFFSAPVTLEEFVGDWLELEPDDRWQLGGAGGLGFATCVGERVWSSSSKFRLCVGPLSLEDYQRFLPGTPPSKRLRAIVRNYAGDHLDWDLNLILHGKDVPQAQLGQSTQLGLTSWIGSEDHPAEVADLFLTPLTDTAYEDGLAA